MAQNNPYANNYAAFSQALDRNLEQQRSEEAHRAEMKRQAAMDDIRQQQLLDMKIKTNEELMIPGDTGISAVDTAISSASRQLVDYAANLKNQLKNGEIDNDQFAQQMAGIRNQVPQLKTFKETINTNVAAYRDALADGSLSGAMKYGDDFYSTLLAKESAFQFGVDDQGVIRLTGLTNSGQGVDIPISGIDQMPKPMTKQPAPSELLLPSWGPKAISTNGVWQPDFEEEAKTQFDTIVGGGKDALMSMAVDHYNMTYQEAEDLYLMPRSYDENGVPEENALSRALQDKWVGDAKQVFAGTWAQNVQAQQKAQLDEMEQRAKIGQLERSNRNIANMKFAQAENLRQQQEGYIAQIAQTQDWAKLSGWNGVQSVNKLPNGQIALYGKDNKQPLAKFNPDNPQEAFQQLNAMFNNYSADPNNYEWPEVVKEEKKPEAKAWYQGIVDWWSGSPTNRLSPLDRGRAASKARENERTKAAHEQARQEKSAEWDRQRKEENVGWGDIAAEAAGGLPYVGALAGAGKVAKAVKGAAKAVGSNITAGAKGAAGGIAETLGQDATNVAAGGIQGGATGAVKGYVKGKIKDAGKMALKKGLKSGLGLAGDVAGAVGKGVGIVGTAKAAYDTGKLINQKMRQDMTDEEYENFKRTGSTSGSRRGRNSRGRTKMG